MAELKTRQTSASVAEFIQSIPDENRRADSQTLVELMREATGDEPKMWGENIVGFGDRRLKYESGRELDWFSVGFSPRKQTLTLYLSHRFEQQQDLLQRLGKYKTGKGCLYLNRLAGADLDALRELVKRVVESQRREG